MVNINFGTRQVSCKIVYYGPGRSGKTTNLEFIHSKVPLDNVGDLISVATEQDRTLYFDFLLLDMGKVVGMNTKFQLFTVPGQVYYNATRKIVLEGADGVIFVADSHPDMMSENIEALENLVKNLRDNNLDPDTMPLVFQWNKRDLASAVPVEELEAALNPDGRPSHESVAVKGQGVLATLKEISKLVIQSLNNDYKDPAEMPAAEEKAPDPVGEFEIPSGPEPVAPLPVAPSPVAPAATPRPGGSGRAQRRRTPSKEVGLEPSEDLITAVKEELNRPDPPLDVKPVTSIGAGGRELPAPAAATWRLRGRFVASALGALAVLGAQWGIYYNDMLDAWRSHLESGSSSAWIEYLAMGGILAGLVIVIALIASLQDRRSVFRCFQLGVAWCAGMVIGLSLYRAERPATPAENLPVSLKLAEVALMPASARQASKAVQIRKEQASKVVQIRKENADRVDELQRQLDDTAETLKTEKAALRKELQAEFDRSSNETVTESTAKQKALQRERDALQQSSAALKQKLDEMETAGRGQADAARKQVQELQDQIKKKDEQIEKLRQELAAAKKAAGNRRKKTGAGGAFEF